MKTVLLLALVALSALCQNTGPDYITIRNTPSLDVRRYNFPARTNGSGVSGDLSVAGSGKVLTFTRCPLGVAGTNTNHYLYISGGAGTAEAVLITGGTCTSGAASGTIILTTANTHTGSWTVQSATAGIGEGLQIIKAAGRGTLELPGASLTLYGPIVLPNNIPLQIKGQGINSSALTLANGANCDGITNENFSTLTGGGTYPAGIYRVTLSDFTLNGNKANQTGTSYGIRIYGHGYTFTNLAVEDWKTTGIYSEYALDPPFTDTTTDLEALWDNVRVSFSGADNIVFRGPHDSFLHNVTSYRAGSWCARFQTNGTTYNGNAFLSNWDTYLCALTDSGTGGIETNTSLRGSNVTASTGVGDGMRMISGAQSIICAACVFGADAGGSGLVLAGNNHVINGYASNTSASANSYAVKLNGVQQASLDLALICGSQGCINFATDSGNNRIVGRVQSSAGPLIVGAPSSTTAWDLSNIYSTNTPQHWSREPQKESWKHYTLTMTAGNWVLTGGIGATSPLTPAAATTQTITLDTVNFPFVTAMVMKTNIAFTGPATVTVNLGTTGSTTFYYAGNYDLKAAVSSTNFVSALANVGLNSWGTIALALTITTSGGNVNTIANGSKLDIWMKYGTPLE